MGRWRKLYRALAVALTVACIVTGSSFSVLAATAENVGITAGTGVTEEGGVENSQNSGSGNVSGSTDESEKTAVTSGTDEDEETPSTPGADGNEGTPSTPGADGNEGTPSTPGADGNEGTPSAPGTDEDEETPSAPGTDENEGDLDKQSTEVVAKITFRDVDGNSIDEKEIKAEAGADGTYTFTEAEVKDTAPEGYIVIEIDMQNATAAADAPAVITAVAEKAADEGNAETTADIKVFFLDEEGEKLEGAEETEIKIPVGEGQTYTVTETDIDKEEVLPEGYVLLKIDPEETIVQAGDKVEITATVISAQAAMAMGGIMLMALGTEPDTKRYATAQASENDDIAIRPADAAVFFDSENEAYSFNTAEYWDIYQQRLGVEAGKHTVGTNSVNAGLTLTSSTDAYLIPGSSSTYGGGDVLRVNYETATTFAYQQYASDGTAETNFNYSDGSSTIVGWGGAVTDNIGSDDRKRLIFSFKSVEGLTEEEILPYMTLYLVAADGSVKNTIKGTDLKNGPDGFGGDYESFKTAANPGYYTYVTENGLDTTVEGLKLVFETPSGSKDVHGTIDIDYVGLYKDGAWGDTDNDYDNFQKKDSWVSFGPFAYIADGSNKYNALVETEKATSSSVLPFLRIPFDNIIHQDKWYGKAGDVSGANIDKDAAWHLWTMSTSDANIVSKAYASNNGTGSYNALEIKYSNSVNHQTTAALSGEEGRIKSGEWLAITMKAEDLRLTGDGEQDNDIKDIHVILKDESNNQIADLALSQFKTSPDENADTFENYIDELTEGYRTLYYHNAEGKINLRTVEFDFSHLPEVQGDNTPNRIYIKDIYLFNPTLLIEKTGDPTVAPGGVINYTITVSNDSATVIEGYTVSDVLPPTLKYVDGSAKTSDGSDVSVTKGSEDGCETLTFSDLRSLNGNNADGSRDSITIEFQAEVPSDANAGTKYRNQAVADMNGNRVISRQVVTEVLHQEDRFYAEVGTAAYLPINLGILEADSEGTAAFVSTRHYETVGKDETNYQDITVRLSVPARGDICFTTKDYQDAGIIMDWIQFDDGEQIPVTKANEGKKFTAHTDRMKDTAAEGEPAENFANGVSIYYDASGYLNNFYGWGNHGYIQFANVNDTDAEKEVKIKFRVKVTADNTTDSRIFEYWAEAGEDTPEPDSGSTGGNNVFSKIVQPEGWDSEIVKLESDGMIFTLEYTSKKTGTEVFQIMYYPGGDTTAEESSIDVTVYNYEVKDHIYVLDYGLPVNLTGTGENPAQDIAAYAEITEIPEADAGTAFRGLIYSEDGSKLNTDAKATDEDYIRSEYKIYSGAEALAGKDGKLSTAYTSGANALTMTFTPTKFMDVVDTFYYGVQVCKNDETSYTGPRTATPVMEGRIQIMPASVVYYEDNFASSGSSADGANGTNGIVYTGSINPNAVNVTITQSNSKDDLYGFDEAYETLENKDSAGGSTAMTADGYNTQATFTFKGTGFDIVGRTTSQKAVLMYSVQRPIRDDEGELTGRYQAVKSGVVDTYYANGDLYQIPVINVKDLAYDEYKVVLMVIVLEKDSQATFYLDGIRIYNPLGTEGNEAYNEVEKGAVTANISEMLLGDCEIKENGVIDPDTGEEIVESYDVKNSQAVLVDVDDIEDNLIHFGGGTYTEDQLGENPTYSASLVNYLKKGPNNEAYLSDYQAVGFVVIPGGETVEGDLQVEAKIVDVRDVGKEDVDAEGLALYMVTEDSSHTLNLTQIETVVSRTAMYYKVDLSRAISLENGAYLVILAGSTDGASQTCISLSNLKYKKGYSVVNPVKNESAKARFTSHGVSGSDYAIEITEMKVASGSSIKRGKTTTFNITLKNPQELDIAGIHVYCDGVDAKPVLSNNGPTENTDGTYTYQVKVKIPAAKGTYNYKCQAFKVDESGNSVESSLFYSTNIQVK